MLPRSTLSVRLGGSEHVPKLRELKPGLLMLPTLPGPLAAALHVCHSSSPSVFAVCLAACSACSPVARCESARPEEQSRPREAHGNVRCKALGTHPSARTCSPRRLQQPAAPSRQTPPNAARAPREFLPLGRRPACRAGVLRWRATRVAARPPTLGWGACYRREGRATLEPRSRATHPKKAVLLTCRPATGRLRGPECESKIWT